MINHKGQTISNWQLLCYTRRHLMHFYKFYGRCRPRTPCNLKKQLS